MTELLTTSPSPSSAPAHGLRQREFVVLMSLVTATVAISIDTVLPAFDQIEAEYGIGGPDSPVSLTITIFFGAMGLGMLIWGPISDRFGRKPTMYSAIALFIIGSMISTFAPTFPVFLIGRAIWGLAAAGPRIVTLAITRDSYSGDMMARIMSLTTAVFLVVPVLAPAFGEVLLEFGSWRLTTGVGSVLGLVAAMRFRRINETLAPEDALPLEFGRVVRAAKVVVTTRSTILFALAGTLGYGAFFPWLGSSVHMISDIYDRPDQFVYLFGANAILMGIVILSAERLVKRFTTYPVLIALTSLMTIVALVYVAVTAHGNGVPSFWLWFAMASVLMALNASSTPLMQTLALEPMGKLAGTASSVTGALTFVGGAMIGSVIDSQITTTVTAFGVGFAIVGAGALSLQLAAGRPSTQRNW